MTTVEDVKTASLQKRKPFRIRKSIRELVHKPHSHKKQRDLSLPLPALPPGQQTPEDEYVYDILYECQRGYIHKQIQQESLLSSFCYISGLGWSVTARKRECSRKQTLFAWFLIIHDSLFRLLQFDPDPWCDVDMEYALDCTLENCHVAYHKLQIYADGHPHVPAPGPNLAVGE